MQTALIILLTVLLVAAVLTAVTLGRRLRRLKEGLTGQREHNRQLAERLTTVERRRSELEAVLSSMVEGVAAIDTEERLISLNRAAALMLSLDPKRAVGRSIQEVVRNASLQSLVTEALGSQANTPATRELSLRLNPGSSTDDRSIQAQAAPVRDAEGRQVGAVVVLHDVTRLRRLESVRRDFVANVSHEIKTPISAIKAAVETLIDDEQMPVPARQNFTGIIARQTERLDAIIEDLLSLTRLEQEGATVSDEIEAHAVEPVIRAACETCHAKAQAKSITLKIEAEPLRAQVVPTLLEQALVNLIDNAIKYSPEDTTVVISAERRNDDAVLAVTDEGRGIEPEHLPRVFERFYRTDRARSRQLGGTGLGLSIVKHIAETMGGKASVRSQLSKGSTFTLTFRAGTQNAAAKPSTGSAVAGVVHPAEPPTTESA
ncbi:sensor histidine kinase [Algisphaera agarilytica]|uniref:histidine kinase n=1 Tax=Algisphaera agarilytica TaxID=1385975 RepID=A0A7X0LKF9_9BACT|nr:ATP-binding protein [Algisphaera agarilytica]MBB6428898.1 PAS domain S-box-containing protein [Algisphaera agarilytica]